MLELYSRGFEAGSAEQMVLVQDGIVRAQWLVPTYPDCHMGDGNPKMVGQPMSNYRGQRFRKVEEWCSGWSRQQFDAFLDQLFIEKVLKRSASTHHLISETATV